MSLLNWFDDFTYYGRRTLREFVRLWGLFFAEGESTDGKKETSYNPWPHYTFSGQLRPFPQSEKRLVPEKIGRPDYADHKLGYPLSEQAVKGSSQIKVLDDEEIEGGIIFVFIINLMDSNTI